LFVAFQPKQPCDFIVTERVHFSAMTSQTDYSFLQLVSDSHRSDAKLCTLLGGEIFGQIRTRELRDSAQFVQTARFAFSPLTRSLTHVYGGIAQSREKLKVGSNPVRVALSFHRRISDVPAFFRELRSAVSVETVRPLECPESRHDGTDVGHFLNDISPFGTGVVFYTWMV